MFVWRQPSCWCHGAVSHKLRPETPQLDISVSREFIHASYKMYCTGKLAVVFCKIAKSVTLECYRYFKNPIWTYLVYFFWRWSEYTLVAHRKVSGCTYWYQEQIFCGSSCPSAWEKLKGSCWVSGTAAGAKVDIYLKFCYKVSYRSVTERQLYWILKRRCQLELWRTIQIYPGATQEKKKKSPSFITSEFNFKRWLLQASHRFMESRSGRDLKNRLQLEGFLNGYPKFILLQFH